MSTLTTDQLIEGVRNTYLRLRGLPGLEVEYRIDREVHQRGSSQVWRWEWAEVLNVIKPTAPGKVFSSFRASGRVAPDRHEVMLRTRSSDGDVQAIYEATAGNEAAQASIPNWASIHSEKREPGAMISIGVDYFQQLAYPLGPNPETGVAPRRQYPEGAYWLPEAVEKNPQAYQVRPHLEQVDGVWCHVLERPGLDVMWIQTDPDLIIRRRIFHWEEGGLLRQDAKFGDPVQLTPGLWLPRQIVFDEYSAPWDNPPLRSNVACRLRLGVSRLISREVSDTEFRIEIPEGTLVFTEDGRRFLHEPGVDPYRKALEELSPRRPWYRLFLFWVIGAALPCLLLLWWILSRWKPKLLGGDTAD